MKRGDKGAEVEELQRALPQHGIAITVDGDYGPATEAAVKIFQKFLGLKVDGIAGPVTMTALGKPPAPAGLTQVVHELVMPTIRCWPLRALADGRKPIITSRHKTHNPARQKHYGADLLYKYDARIDPPTKVGDSGRTARPGHPGEGFWIPPETYAVACANGIVERCGPSATGYYVWVRHPGGLATGGFHFDKLVVSPGQVVKMGDALGRVNDNPKDTDPDHLHGELYRGPLVGSANQYPLGTIDPELWWNGAQVLPALR